MQEIRKRQKQLRQTAYNRSFLDIVTSKTFQKRVAVFTLLFMMFQVFSPFLSIIQKGAVNAAVSDSGNTNTYISSFKLQAGSGSVHWSMSVASNVTSAKVYQVTTMGDKYVATHTFTSSAHSASHNQASTSSLPITNGTELTYKVIPYVGSSVKTTSASLASVTPASFGKPTATASDKTYTFNQTTGGQLSTPVPKIKISWSGLDTRYTKIIVTRSTSSTGTETAVTGGTSGAFDLSKVSSITDTSGLKLNTTYYYHLTGQTNYSEKSSDTVISAKTNSDNTNPSAPTNISVTNYKNSARVSFTKGAGSSLTAVWKMSAATGGTSTYQSQYLTSSSNAILLNLTNGTDYYYQFAAVDDVGNVSARTATFTVNPDASADPIFDINITGTPHLSATVDGVDFTFSSTNVALLANNGSGFLINVGTAESSNHDSVTGTSLSKDYNFSGINSLGASVDDAFNATITIPSDNVSGNDEVYRWDSTLNSGAGDWSKTGITIASDGRDATANKITFTVAGLKFGEYAVFTTPSTAFDVTPATPSFETNNIAFQFGSLGTNTGLNITADDSSAPSGAAPSGKAIARDVSIEATNQTGAPVTSGFSANVSIYYDGVSSTDNVAWWNPTTNAWINDLTVTARDTANSSITFTTPHFTEFAVLTSAASSNFTVSATASPSAGGSVQGAGTVASNDSRTLTAIPNGNYTFSNWTGDCAGATNPISFTNITANKACVAVFTATSGSTVTVSATASPLVGGTVTGAGTVNSGDGISLTAQANNGYGFSDWTGDCSGTDNPVTVSEVTTNISCTAVFTVSTSGDGGTGGTTGDGGTTGGADTLPEAGASVLNLLINMLLAGALLSLMVMYSRKTKYAYILN